MFMKNFMSRTGGGVEELRSLFFPTLKKFYDELTCISLFIRVATLQLSSECFHVRNALIDTNIKP